MAQERPDYLSYMLRMWRAREDKREVWRASLQSPQSGERVSFRTLEALFAFLRQQTGAAPDSDGDPEAKTGQGAL
jgi:hypothetical protein